jgi:hypothetical protein
LILKFFRKCGVSIILLPLILALFCLAGCIQENALPEEAAQGKVAEAHPRSIEINFDPEVGSRLFRVKGNLKISGNGSLPYLLLNATLLKNGRLLCSTKYLMMDIGPERDCSFEISRNLRTWPGSYSCVLEASGPDGQMASEVRECRVIGPFLVEPAPALERMPSMEEISLAKGQGGVLEKSTKAGASIQEKKAKNMDESSASSSSPLPPEEASGQREDDMEDGMGGSFGDQAARALKSGLKAVKESLVGSTASNKYHRQNCRYADKIRADNRVYFASEEEAKSQGYSPCKACAP